MKNSSQKQRSPEAKEMDEKLAVINKANEASVLMTVLCEKLDLVPNTTTHQQFIERFGEIQRKSLDYQKELQEMYISTGQVKTRKKREPNISKAIKEAEEYANEHVTEEQKGPEYGL